MQGHSSQTGGRTGGRADERTDGRTGARAVERTDGQVEQQIKRCAYEALSKLF